MSQTFLPNARGNKIVVYLSDAKLKLDTEFAKLSTEFELMSNYPPKPNPTQIVKWAKDLKTAVDELMSRVDGLVLDAMAEDNKVSSGQNTQSAHITSNYPPSKPPTI